MFTSDQRLDVEVVFGAVVLALVLAAPRNLYIQIVVAGSSPAEHCLPRDGFVVAVPESPELVGNFSRVTLRGVVLTVDLPVIANPDGVGFPILAKAEMKFAFGVMFEGARPLVEAIAMRDAAHALSLPATLGVGNAVAFLPISIAVQNCLWWRKASGGRKREAQDQRDRTQKNR